MVNGGWRLQAKAVDAARQQHYEDQLAWVRGQGPTVVDLRQPGLPRCGPRRLHLGPRAFAQAREATFNMWNDAILRA